MSFEPCTRKILVNQGYKIEAVTKENRRMDKEIQEMECPLLRGGEGGPRMGSWIAQLERKQDRWAATHQKPGRMALIVAQNKLTTHFFNGR